MNEIKGKILKGKVAAIPTAKTVIVTVESVFRHPLYRKAVRRTRRFAAHNESIALVVGDSVSIQESKPISRTKHFIVKEKIT